MNKKRRILIADSSKVVRATLMKHLKDDFEVREEADGESAWQTLVLDASIVAVISGVALSRQSGYELLARLRGNRLRRLADIPFLLVISDTEPHESRRLAKEKGVTDFITRGMSKADIQSRIRRLVDWEFATVVDIATLAQAVATPAVDAGLLDAPQLRILLDGLVSAAPEPDKPGADTLICVVAFSLDDEARIAAEFGSLTAARIWRRFIDTVRPKIGRRDVIGSLSPSSCLIVSPGTSYATGVAFAQRVCRGLSEGSVRVGEARFTSSISVGIATLPEDRLQDAESFIRVACERMLRARNGGGNRVVAGDVPPEQLFGSDYFLALAQQIATGTDTPHLAELGLKLMPLLEFLDRELKMELPLKQLTERLVAQQGDGTRQEPD